MFNRRLRKCSRAIALLVAAALSLAVASSASAAITAKPHGWFLATTFGSFSLSLDTRSSTQIVAGPVSSNEPKPPTSRILVVCPKAAATDPIMELHLGFPGATLRLSHGRYSFSRTYTENAARNVNFATKVVNTVSGVRASITGTVTRPGLIKGTVSVQAPGCNLKRSPYVAEYSERLR